MIKNWAAWYVDMIHTCTIESRHTLLLSRDIPHLRAGHRGVEHVDADDAVADHEEQRPGEHHPVPGHPGPPHLHTIAFWSQQERVLRVAESGVWVP